MVSEDQMAANLFGPPPSQDTTALTTGMIEPKVEPVTEQVSELASNEPADKPTPRTAEQMQESIYENKVDDEALEPVPADVAEIRENPERRMFSPQMTLREAIRNNEFAELADEKVARKAVRELREMSADLDFGPKEIQTLRDRAAFVHKTKPVAISQREAAVEALNREFGKDAKQALRDARALLQRDARTAKVIEAMGIGDDPETVLLVARAARSQRQAGKLKGK